MPLSNRTGGGNRTEDIENTGKFMGFWYTIHLAKSLHGLEQERLMFKHNTVSHLSAYSMLSIQYLNPYNPFWNGGRNNTPCLLIAKETKA